MDVFEAAWQARRDGQPFVLCTVIETGGSTPRGAGARMVVFTDGHVVGTIGGGAVEHAVVEASRAALADRRSRRVNVALGRDLGMCCGGRMEVLVDFVEARPTLWIYGAGHVAAALAPIAVALDFAVVVVDDRDALAVAERFPGARVMRADPEQVARTHTPGSSDWHIVLTHDHALDQAVTGHLLDRDCAWLGLIGSRAKVARFLTRWTAEGRDPSTFRKLCAPVGLDVGAETPAEIAVSIAAELVRVRRHARRAPASLADQPIPGRAAYEPPAWSEAPPPRGRISPCEPGPATRSTDGPS